MDFRVDLSIFRGPLDLLLYLVRKHEVEIAEIPISSITEQYLEYLAVLKELDVDAVGEFVALASTLIEIKSQQVLPRCDEVDDTLEDPREDLVRRLLEYKKFRDAACILEERGRLWQQQYPRLVNDLPPREHDLADDPIQEIELWDLVSAFGRVLRTAELNQPSSILYDDTPIHVYMTRIQDRLKAAPRLAFTALFEPGMHKSKLVGIFLAMLELVRHHQVGVEQSELFGEIWISPRKDRTEMLDPTSIDNYDHCKA